MTQERKNTIEQIALNLYQKHFQRGSPASKIRKIIDNEGLWYSEIDGGKKFLGALSKIGDHPLHIQINQNIDNEGRKNFTIAHELGHYALDHHLTSSVFYCNEDHIKEEGDADNEQEKEANHFASCFLMQRQRVINEFTNWFSYNFPNQQRTFLYVNFSNPQSKKYWNLFPNSL